MSAYIGNVILFFCDIHLFFCITKQYKIAPTRESNNFEMIFKTVFESRVIQFDNKTNDGHIDNDYNECIESDVD